MVFQTHGTSHYTEQHCGACGVAQFGHSGNPHITMKRGFSVRNMIAFRAGLAMPLVSTWSESILLNALTFARHGW